MQSQCLLPFLYAQMFSLSGSYVDALASRKHCDPGTVEQYTQYSPYGIGLTCTNIFSL